MKTLVRTIRKQAPRLCIASVAVVIAAPGAGSGVNRTDPLASRLQIYPFEAPFVPGQRTATPSIALAERLHIYPYEAPFAPEPGPAQASPPPERLHIYPYESPFGP